MLTALMSGRALTVTELAQKSGVTLQTASAHLTKLHAGGLLHPRKQGRHKYFSLANDDVAHVLESLMGLAAGSGHTRTGPRDPALRHARVCYNHLAGHMGTRMFDSILANGHITIDDNTVTLTNIGHAAATNVGIDMPALQTNKPLLCRECLDWSARRSHLAGSLGRAYLSRFETLGWIKRDAKSRVVTFSKSGEQKFHALFTIPAP